MKPDIEPEKRTTRYDPIPPGYDPRRPLYEPSEGFSPSGPDVFGGPALVLVAFCFLTLLVASVGKMFGWW